MEEQLKEEIKESSLKARRIIVTFLSITTIVLLIFLARLNLDMQSELREIKSSLAMLQERAAKQPLPKMISEPFAVLEESCSRCHNEQKFMGMHKTPYEIRHILESMESHPEIEVSDQKKEQIYASLLLLRCAGCHAEDQIGRFANLTLKERQIASQEQIVHAKAGIYRQDMEEAIKVYTRIRNY